MMLHFLTIVLFPAVAAAYISITSTFDPDVKWTRNRGDDIADPRTTSAPPVVRERGLNRAGRITAARGNLCGVIQGELGEFGIDFNSFTCKDRPNYC